MKPSQYLSNIKSLSVFGGAQILDLFISLIRGKCAAVLLGPIGVGINSMLNSTFNLAFQAYSVGFFQSSVRDISKAFKTGNLKTTLSNLYSISLLIAVIGSLLTFILAPLFSKLSFGNHEYRFDFMILSLAILFYTLYSWNVSLLQGTHQIKRLATASVLGNFFGLFGLLAIFLLKNDGIAISITITYLSLFIVNKYFANKSELKIKAAPIVSAVKESKTTLSMGFAIMISALAINAFNYIFSIYIRSRGGLDDLGLYQSSYSIISKLFLIVSSVLASEYYPRISAISDDNRLVSKSLYNEAELLVLVIVPASTLLIVFAPFVVKLLLSSSFIATIPLMRSMSLALVFRVVWIAVSYIFLAKGAKKMYFWFDAIVGNMSGLIINIVMYHLFGLQGLGLSFILSSLFVSILLMSIVRYKYDIVFPKAFYTLIAFLVALMTAVYFIVSYFDSVWAYSIVAVLLITMCYFSYSVVRKRLLSDESN